jgi:hypothetical protein
VVLRGPVLSARPLALPWQRGSGVTGIAGLGAFRIADQDFALFEGLLASTQCWAPTLMRVVDFMVRVGALLHCEPGNSCACPPYA